MRVGRIGALALCVAMLSGCSEDAKPTFQSEPEPTVAVPEYDATLEPSAAVLTLVPEGASSLTVTDFDQVRLLLGFGAPSGELTAEDRGRFWRQLPRTAALSQGLLRPVDGRLRQQFGISQDDVSWEARYEGDVSGWVLAFHDDVPMAAVARAVRARVGPLAGAVVDEDRHLVTSGEPPAITESWGAEPEIAALVGRSAASTYVQRGCLEFDTVFGAGMEQQLAAAPADAIDDLQPLDAFAVTFGAQLATVQLGTERSDAFERLRIAELMPRTEPEFGLVMSRGVADPSTGRLGYVLEDPVAAVQLTRTRQLPFAVCAG